MKKYILFTILFSMSVLSCLALTGKERLTLQKIKSNLVNLEYFSSDAEQQLVKILTELPVDTIISDRSVVELYQKWPLQWHHITKLLDTMNADGSWMDVDYKSKNRSGWKPKLHVERLLQLVRYYVSVKPESYDAKLLEEKIHLALNYWLTADLLSLNWWHNEVGIPKTLGVACLMFEDNLTIDEKVKVIRVLDRAKFKMTGQNKVWLAGNILMRALLQNNYVLAKHARDTILSVLVLGDSEGIKSDWSFHQHGPQQQFGNYGLAFLSSMCYYAELFKGTTMAFSEEQIQILSNLLEQGFRWITWKGQMDINALDRQLFHNAPWHKGLMLGAVAVALNHKSFIDDNFSTKDTLNQFVGHKHFWTSDQTVHRTSTWMASLKMSSKRVIGSELVNEDNLRGYYMGDGAMYVYTKDNDYLNVFPFWDWRKIPGITCYESSKPVIWPRNVKRSYNYNDYVGGITDGSTGLTVMHVNKDGLTAHKAWVMTDNWILCLGNSIHSDSALHVTTAVDQKLKNGDFSYLKEDKWYALSGRKEFTDKEQRFYHAGIGYVLWNTDKIRSIAEEEKRTGSWSDFMGIYKQSEVENEVMSLHIAHSAHANAYQYLVIPNVTQEQVADFKLSDVKIYSNTEHLQMVYANGIYYVSAVKPQKVKFDKLVMVNIKTPGLYLFVPGEKKYKIGYVDPTQTLDTAEIMIGEKAYQFTIKTVEKGTTVWAE